MKYMYITKNTSQDKNTMEGYTGTQLIYTDPTFLVWLWVDPVMTDLQATQGLNPSVNVVAMTMINIV